MRELRFRAWWQGRYVYDVAPSQEIGEAVRISQDWNWDEDGEEYPVYDITGYGEEIEQFTGLHDRNGREIYEGDILRSDLTDVRGVVELHWCWWVRHINAATGTTLKKFYHPATGAKIEVIGNIHENQELLP